MNERSSVTLLEDNTRLRGLVRHGLEDAEVEVVLGVSSSAQLLEIEQSGATLVVAGIRGSRRSSLREPRTDPRGIRSPLANLADGTVMIVAASPRAAADLSSSRP